MYKHGWLILCVMTAAIGYSGNLKWLRALKKQMNSRHVTVRLHVTSKDVHGSSRNNPTRPKVPVRWRMRRIGGKQSLSHGG